MLAGRVLFARRSGCSSLMKKGRVAVKMLEPKRFLTSVESKFPELTYEEIFEENVFRVRDETRRQRRELEEINKKMGELRGKQCRTEHTINFNDELMILQVKIEQSFHLILSTSFRYSQLFPCDEDDSSPRDPFFIARAHSDSSECLVRDILIEFHRGENYVINIGEWGTDKFDLFIEKNLDGDEFSEVSKMRREVVSCEKTVEMSRGLKEELKKLDFQDVYRREKFDQAMKDMGERLGEKLACQIEELLDTKPVYYVKSEGWCREKFHDDTWLIELSCPVYEKL